MRRLYPEIRELVEARAEDFINGHASEDVLKASLKCLHLDREEIALEVWKAKVEKERRRVRATEVRRIP